MPLKTKKPINIGDRVYVNQSLNCVNIVSHAIWTYTDTKGPSKSSKTHQDFRFLA